MNFNPFVNKNHHSKRLNMFDHMVGRPEQMGMFDYILVLPFLIKTIYHYSAQKPKLKALTILSALISAPLAVVKFGLYIGLSPAIFVGWGIKKAILKKQMSPFTRLINELEVITLPEPGQDPEHLPAQKLKHMQKLHDSEITNYNIRVHNNELQLVRGFNNQLVATIPKTDANMDILNGLVTPPEGDDNGLTNWLNNFGGRNFFAPEVKAVVDTFIHDRSVGKASSYFRDVHTLLVLGKGDLEILPKEVKRIIAAKVIQNETATPSPELKALQDVGIEERTEAFSRYARGREIYLG